MADSEARYDAIAEWYAAWVETESWAHPTIRRHLTELTGPVAGQAVLDVACGDAVFAVELAAAGAAVKAVDLSAGLLAKAQERVATSGLAVTLRQDDAQRLKSLGEAGFDGAICVLALMDIHDLAAVYRAIARVVRPGGWLVIAITHPCFDAPHADWVERDDEFARVTGTYLSEGHWVSRYAQGVRGRVGAQHRTMSTYLNTACEAGWTLEQMVEPACLTHEGEPVGKGREIPRLLLARFTRIRSINVRLDR